MTLLENLYQETFSAVRDDGYPTDWFRSLIGLLQGCVLSPMLLNIFLVTSRAADGVAHLGAVICGCTISNLRFADDNATLAKSSDDFQPMVSNIHREGSKMGIHINAAKTETQYFSKENQIIGLSVKMLHCSRSRALHTL